MDAGNNMASEVMRQDKTRPDKHLRVDSGAHPISLLLKAKFRLAGGFYGRSGSPNRGRAEVTSLDTSQSPVSKKEGTDYASNSRSPSSSAYPVP